MKGLTLSAVASILLLSACRASDSYVEVPVSEFARYEGLPGHNLEAPASGFVPDAATAVRIAEAVLEATYGNDALDGQRPLRVAHHEGVWVLFGTLPENFAGGVAHIEIAQADGRVIRVSHGA